MQDSEIQQVLDYFNEIVQESSLKQPASYAIEIDPSSTPDSILGMATIGELVFNAESSALSWNTTNSEWECVSFYSLDRMDPAVQINFTTGDIQISDWMTTDASAQLFWDRVQALNPLKTEAAPVEPPLSDAERALIAYTRAMKVVE